MNKNKDLVCRITYTKEQSAHLKTIAASIMDTLKDDLGSVMGYIRILKQSASDNIGMIIEDKKFLIANGVAEPSDEADIETLFQVEEALKNGMLLEASIGIMNLKDDLAQEMAFAGFKELTSYVSCAESMIAAMPMENVKKLSQQSGHIKENGYVELKEIDKFVEKDFMRDYSRAMEDQAPEQNMQESKLPEFDNNEDMGSSIQPK